MKNNFFQFIKKYYQLLILLFFIILFVYFTQNNLDVFKKLLNLKIKDLLILSLLQIWQIALTGYIFKLVLKKININLNINEWFGLTILNRLSNHILTKTGILTRGIYLKKKYGLSYQNFIIAMIVITASQIMAASLTAVFFIYYFYLKENIFYSDLFVFSIVIFFLILIILISKNKVLNFFSNKHKIIFNGENNILKNDLFVQITFLSLGSLLIYGLRTHYLFLCLSKPIPFLHSLLISITGFLSTIISITPGALGVKETLMSLAYRSLGGDFRTAILVSSSDRAILIFWLLILGFYFSKKLFKKNDDQQTNNNN